MKSVLAGCFFCLLFVGIIVAGVAEFVVWAVDRVSEAVGLG